MKNEKFNEIFKGKYSIKDNRLYYNDNELCNFYIKEITRNIVDNRDISFTVKIKSPKAKEKHTIPIMYWDSPYIWLRSEFDMEKFEINVSKDEYEKHIKEIINTLLRKGEIETDDKTPGWNVENDIGFNPDAVKFREYDNLENISKNEYEKHNYIKDYINLIDRNISVPLFAYLLASTLSSLHFIPKDFDRKFIVSMTGGTMRNRECVALMFTNVHNRSREFCLAKQYFEMHHLLKADTTAEILHKAKAGKDSVVIAFEPDRKMSNYIKKVFIDNMDNYDVQSNCFIIAKYAEEIPFETLNIDIPAGFDEKNIDNYFRNEDYEDIHSDYFMESIYYFVSRLCDKIHNDKKYLRKKYKEFRDNNSYNQEYFKGLSDNAYNIAVKLCFAYEMYMKTYKEDYKADFCRIVAVVKRSFPTDDEMRNKQLREISKICCALDNYFNESKHKKYILGLDEVQTSDIVKLKYDENNLYIRADIINEILKIAEFPGNFSVDIKKTLAEEHLIASYLKNDGKREYSVHLPKPKDGSNKTQARYIAFSRENCRAKNLFPKIEEYISEKTRDKLSNSCQKD